jgi:hypothetical protein
MKTKIRWSSLVIGLFASGVWAHAQSNLFTNQVEKVADLNSVLDSQGNINGGYKPQGRLSQSGTNLWFTTAGGGINGDGTVSKFSLVEHAVTQVASFNKNVEGTAAGGPILILNDATGYFTAQQGGSSSNKGTIVKIDLASGVTTPLFVFYTTNGANPRSGPFLIGDDLWTMGSLGGTSNRGSVVKYSLTAGTNAVLTNFDGPVIGGYPYATPVEFNGAWYFTSFIGGSTFGQAGIPLGAGTFERLSFNSNGVLVISKLADLAAGYTQFPGGAPLLVGTNSFYFLTAGANSTPGALVRYDLDTGLWTNLWSFTTNAPAANAYGKQPGYNGMVEWLGELYFLTRLGGVSNNGVVAKFNIASNTVVKLADLDGQKGPLALGTEVNGFNNDPLIVLETNRYFAYFTVYAGGVYNYGTILRVYLPPQPIRTTLAQADNDTVQLSWVGGYPPFDVVTNSDLSLPLTNWGVALGGINSVTNTTNWSVTLPAPPGNTFYRVRGQAQ